MRIGSNWVVSYNLVSSTRSRSHDKNSTNVWKFQFDCMLCRETFHYTIPQMTNLQKSRSSLGCFWISSLSMKTSLGRISFVHVFSMTQLKFTEVTIFDPIINIFCSIVLFAIYTISNHTFPWISWAFLLHPKKPSKTPFQVVKLNHETTPRVTRGQHFNKKKQHIWHLDLSTTKKAHGCHQSPQKKSTKKQKKKTPSCWYLDLGFTSTVRRFFHHTTSGGIRLKTPSPAKKGGR